MDESAGNTWLNALIGAVVTIVFSFTIISPILGGAAAGYLERTRGVRAGAIAGVIAIIPMLLFGIALVGLLALPGGAPRLFSLFFVFGIFIIIPIYVIGLSALGGYLGEYIRSELV